jgi:hypothetical protein
MRRADEVKNDRTKNKQRERERESSREVSDKRVKINQGKKA